MNLALLKLEEASATDARALAELHTSVAEHLTDTHGRGRWSSKTTEKGVLYAMRNSEVFVARLEGKIVATLRLATKKPWAIDVSYFSPSKKPLYLIGMAVTPPLQRRGLGRLCMDEAKRIARSWPADVIRLDAYDAPAGAGGFYSRCGLVERGRRTYRDAPLVYYEWLLA